MATYNSVVTDCAPQFRIVFYMHAAEHKVMNKYKALFKLNSSWGFPKQEHLKLKIIFCSCFLGMYRYTAVRLSILHGFIQQPTIKEALETPVRMIHAIYLRIILSWGNYIVYFYVSTF